MQPMLPRRIFLRCGGIAAALAAVGAGTTPLDALLSEIEQRSGGRIGLFATGGGLPAPLGWRADDMFIMESTFKAPLAALALLRVQRGEDRLDAPVRYGPEALMPVSPVTAAHVGEGQLPVATLVAAILERSDNCAANLLLARLGGPAALTAFLRLIGDTVTTIRRAERIGAPRAGANTTSPHAFAETIRALCTGPTLDQAMRTRLIDGMHNNRAGAVRLRAALPVGWHAADRTGTVDGICNDALIAWPPNQPPLLLSVFFDAPRLEIPEQEAMLRQIGAAVLRAL